MNTGHMTDRISTGVGAASTLRAALAGPGRPGRVSRMLEQICWRHDTRLLRDGKDLGCAADQVTISLVDHVTPHLVTTTVTSLTVAGIRIPMTGRSRRLVYEGRGVWIADGHRIEIVQPEAERHTFH